MMMELWFMTCFKFDEDTCLVPIVEYRGRKFAKEDV
ncbi:MAG: hypothetical protein JG782_1114 [Anaerophaga sp.]|nr:hypothetical protein [Anaerophaga sp.]